MNQSINLAVDQRLVHLHNGKPVTNSLIIAMEFGRRHENVLQSLTKLIAEGMIGHLDFKESFYLNGQEKKQRLIELSERAALFSMPFIGGRKSRQGQARLVDAFLKMRDESIQQSTWLDTRREVSVSFCRMMDALKEVRAEVGKDTQSHHYSNEVKMINQVVFGNSAKLDRARLTKGELNLLEKIESRNTYLIARGRNFQEHKKELAESATSERLKLQLSCLITMH